MIDPKKTFDSFLENYLFYFFIGLGSLFLLVLGVVLTRAFTVGMILILALVMPYFVGWGVVKFYTYTQKGKMK